MADGKRCIICGEDCTDRPRIKNSKGQYACRACVEAKKAAQGTPKGSQQDSKGKPAGAGQSRSTPGVAASASGAALMERWASNSTEGKIAMGTVEQPKCPKCDHNMMPDTVICMGCGFNTQSGRKIYTKIQKAEKSASSGGGVSLGGANTMIVVGLIAAVGLIAGAAVTGEAGVFIALIAAIWTLAAWIMMIVAAFQDGDQKWGIMGLCTLVPCLGIPPALAFTFYYCIVGSTRTGWKANYWLSVLAYIGCYAAVAINNPEMFASDF